MVMHKVMPFRRNGGELIQAVIWFCDLRDFTAISDRALPAKVVEMLDLYFDRVGGAVTAQGGEVLKFIGDAVLVISPVGVDPNTACAHALLAAADALEAINQLNRSQQLESVLAIGIALHVGEVMYGNIGSRERLDFTVISSAVNETCRLEALCKTMKTPLMLSKPFANALTNEDLVDLGPQVLKGVTSPVRVFSLRRYCQTD